MADVEGVGDTVLDILNASIDFGVTETPQEAARGNWLIGATDDELLAAYALSSRNPADKDVAQMLDVMRFRGINF